MAAIERAARGGARAGAPPGSDREFGKFWAAQSVTLLGSNVTALALPLLAALTLGATPAQMGLLAACGQLPFLLVSLPAGIWVDRVRRRPILIGTDLGSALLLLSIPVAAALGWLGFAQLCIVAAGVGTLVALGEIAQYAYVPALVGRERLVASNSRVQISHSAATAAGPGIGGLLIQALTAPIAIIVDAASFLLCALLVGLIARPEPVPARPPRAEPLASLLTAGVRSLLAHPLLRPIILVSIGTGLCLGAFDALLILYATRELGLGPLALGLVFGVGGTCAIPGALLAGRAARRWGVGRSIIGGWVIEGLAALLVPLAGGPFAATVAILALSRAILGLGDTVANIHQWSLRQAVTPDALQGRVTAGHRFLVYGAAALGALVGGALGGALGLRPTLILCAIGIALVPLFALATPLRHLREQPTAAAADVDGG